MYVGEWAEQGRVSQDKMKQMELQFLCALNWNLFVSNVDFFKKLKSVEIELARRQGLRRGWLTYTELTQLIPTLVIAKTFLQYSTLFTVSYAASVFTIAGAFFLASQVPGTALYSCLKPTNDLQPKSTDISLVNTTATNFILAYAQDTQIAKPDFDHLKQKIEEDEPFLPLFSHNLSIVSVMSNMPGMSFVLDCISRSGINLRKYLDDGNTANSKHLFNTTGNITIEYLELQAIMSE